LALTTRKTNDRRLKFAWLLNLLSIQHAAPSSVYVHFGDIAFHSMVVDELLHAHFLTDRIASRNPVVKAENR
jgi:hypothetical protein